VYVRRIQALTIVVLLLFIVTLPQSAVANGGGPQISGVSVTDVTDVSAEISWEVTSNATITTNLVRYGTSCTSLNKIAYAANVSNPSVVLTGLSANTTYYFKVESADSSGTSTHPADGCRDFKTDAPTTYLLSLEPTCGMCGELITVDGKAVCGELIRATATVADAGTYYICWGAKTAANVVCSFTANRAGTYTCEFFLPLTYKGIHTIYLVAGSPAGIERATTTFTVNPFVKISPEQGPVGTRVTFNGYGFDRGQQIQVVFRGGPVATATADITTGNWTASYTIQPTPGGHYTFEIQAKEGTDFWPFVFKSFKVIPKITVSPESGTVGQAIAINGTGFGSREAGIKVTFDGEVRNQNIFADADGCWNTYITVPARTRGRYLIDASGALTRARDVDEVTFTLVQGISVDPTSAYVGDTIIIKGGGFAPGETGIQVSLDNVPVPTPTITADVYGCWESSFTLPASAYGNHTVSASGPTTAAATTTLTTKARITAVSPTEGAPGDQISLTGNGFGSSKKLTVTLGGIPVSALSSDRTQFNGDVVISFRVPKGSLEGTRTLVVSDESGATDSLNFTVTTKTLSLIPLPISPENESKSRSGEITFRWQGITGNTGYTYTLQVNKVDGAASWSRANITGSSYTLTKDEALSQGTYSWRVKIVDDYGNEGPWSDATEFTVSPIPIWVWVVVGLVVLLVLMVVAYRETRFRVTE